MSKLDTHAPLPCPFPQVRCTWRNSPIQGRAYERCSLDAATPLWKQTKGLQTGGGGAETRKTHGGGVNKPSALAPTRHNRRRVWLRLDTPPPEG
jgi:hypothetical protein